jgi:DNA replication and repair protein RecF
MSAGGATVNRTIAVDDKPVKRISAAFGVLSAVLFVPEDLMLARAAPAARRRFLDMAAAGTAPAYLGESATFQRVLRGRNALLRSGRAAGSDAWLDTVDEQLARAGARLVVRRRAFVREMAPQAQAFFRALHADLAVELVYDADETVAAASSEEAVAGALLAGLGARRAIDLRRRHTTFGPQTDDLGIRLAGRLAREHASQGQLRSLMLSLKLAELVLVGRARGETGVLLLDDVPSELDLERRRFLFDTLTALGCQCVLSVADRGVVPMVPGRADIRVAGGRIAAVAAGQDFSLLGPD